jgi:predicted dehydrogenase
VREFRVGMLGCGGIANAHARVLQELENVRFAAFCDIAEERARVFAERYAAGESVPVFTDHRAMYDGAELDVVWICLPPFAHTDEVEQAAARGVHVFIEKPIALDMEKAESMVAAAESAGIKTQVGFMMRFGSAVEEIKRLLDSGEAGPAGLMIGKYFCNSLHAPWWREKEKSGGQMVEQIIHTFDLVRYFLGRPRSVFARTANRFHRDVERYTAEDVSVTAIEFESGALATVAGTNGAIPGQWISSAELVAGKLTASIAGPNDATLHLTDRDPVETRRIQKEQHGFRLEAEDLLNAIETGGMTRTPIREGAETLRLVLAARDAGERGEVVAL